MPHLSTKLVILSFSFLIATASFISSVHSMELFAGDGAMDDLFGSRVSISGDTMAVGANADDDNGSNSGSVYIFTLDSNGMWNEQQKLIASNGAANDGFGVLVSISGDTLAVYSSGSATLYFFTRDTNGIWSEQQLLALSLGTIISMSLSNDCLVLGDFTDNENGFFSGAAYVFTRDSMGIWSEQQKLTASDATSSAIFGVSVSIFDDSLLVGASGDLGMGAGYIFTRDSMGVWSEQQKLTASDGMLGDNFGRLVSISNNSLILTSADNSALSRIAAAYIFTRDSMGVWSEQQRLTASDGVMGDRFGGAVSISGNNFIVGAAGDFSGQDLGAAYVFSRNLSSGLWIENKLIADDGMASDQFGISVGISDGNVVVGANQDDDNGTNAGSVYTFDIDQDDDLITDLNDADLDGDGIPNLIEDMVGLNSNNTNDGILDLDSDGWINVDEYRLGTEINNPISNPAGQVNPHQKIFASDGASDDQLGSIFSALFYGESVSIDDDTLVLGSYLDDDKGMDSGSAYVFARDSMGIWSELQKLTASDGNTNDSFGASVSIKGNTLVIGSPDNNTNGIRTGSAYVFTRDTNGVWVELQNLVASDGANNDLFGTSVSISDNAIVVGAVFDDDNGTESGSVYIFTQDNNGIWNEHQKLLASNGMPADLFGNNVSVFNDMIVVSSVFGDGTNVDSGSAYVYTPDGNGFWSEQQLLQATDGASTDLFGTSISLSEDTILIGASGDDDNGTSSGSSYVFTRNGNNVWSQLQKLTASDAMGSNFFGHRVSISNEILIISAFGNSALYVFSRDINGSWHERERLVAVDGMPGEFFGGNLSISDDTLIVSAYFDDDTGSNSGTAYLFDLDLDNDSLNNTFENEIGTDSNDVDSDNDGLSDFDEVNFDGDPDNFTVGSDTDPNNSDTDGDNFADGDEVAAGSDPLDINSTPITINTVNVPLPRWTVLFTLLFFFLIQYIYAKNLLYSKKCK